MYSLVRPLGLRTLGAVTPGSATFSRDDIEELVTLLPYLPESAKVGTYPSNVRLEEALPQIQAQLGGGSVVTLSDLGLAGSVWAAAADVPNARAAKQQADAARAAAQKAAQQRAAMDRQIADAQRAARDAGQPTPQPGLEGVQFQNGVPMCSEPVCTATNPPSCSDVPRACPQDAAGNYLLNNGYALRPDGTAFLVQPPNAQRPQQPPAQQPPAAQRPQPPAQRPLPPIQPQQPQRPVQQPQRPAQPWAQQQQPMAPSWAPQQQPMPQPSFFGGLAPAAAPTPGVDVDVMPLMAVLDIAAEIATKAALSKLAQLGLVR